MMKLALGLGALYVGVGVLVEASVRRDAATRCAEANAARAQLGAPPMDCAGARFEPGAVLLWPLLVGPWKGVTSS